MGLSTVCRMAIFLQESLSTGQAHGLLELTSRNVGILEPRRLYTASFDIRNWRASTRITLRAKNGVSPTRNRNCFSGIGTKLTSVAAIAFALRGAASIRAISPKMEL